MKYYRVKIGFGKDDFISIDETELQRAIIASGTGRMALFKEGTVAGNHIISIIPDYQRALGYSREYTLSSEDYVELGKERQNEYSVSFADACREADKLGTFGEKKLLS